MKTIRSWREAESAYKAVYAYYIRIIEQAAEQMGGMAPLSRHLGFKSDMHVSLTLKKGKFAAIRRMAKMIVEQK